MCLLYTWFPSFCFSLLHLLALVLRLKQRLNSIGFGVASTTTATTQPTIEWNVHCVDGLFCSIKSVFFIDVFSLSLSSLTWGLRIADNNRPRWKMKRERKKENKLSTDEKRSERMRQSFWLFDFFSGWIFSLLLLLVWQIHLRVRIFIIRVKSWISTSIDTWRLLYTFYCFRRNKPPCSSWLTLAFSDRERQLLSLWRMEWEVEWMRQRRGWEEEERKMMCMHATNSFEWTAGFTSNDRQRPIHWLEREAHRKRLDKNANDVYPIVIGFNAE